MIRRTLKKIESMVGGSLSSPDNKEMIVHGVSIDSRQIKPHQLYIPIKGERFNGHDFIEDVAKKGAAATLWNRDEPLPKTDIPLIIVEDTLTALQDLARAYRHQLHVKVIGITGTNGKTSVKDILASLLKKRYKTQKTFGNLNNHLGVPLTLLSLEEDTEMAVVEMGISNLGELTLLTEMASPDAALITNIGEAHLEGLKNRETVAKAKLEIIKGLKPNGLLAYLGDEPLLTTGLAHVENKFDIRTYGSQSHNMYRPELISMKETGISFQLDLSGSPTFFVPMLGKHQMYNATAAIIIARYFDLSFEEIQEGLSAIDMTGSRNELIITEKCAVLNDSYKSNPPSLLAALDTLYNLDQFKTKVAVLGDMQGLGDGEIGFHQLIGRQLDPKHLDYLLTIGPLAHFIAEEAKKYFSQNRIFEFHHKPPLMQKLNHLVNPDSIVLIKASRGFQMEEIVQALKS